MANLVATLNVMSTDNQNVTIQGSVVYGGGAIGECFFSVPGSAFDDTPENMMQALKDAVEDYANNVMQVQLQPGEQVYILGGVA